MTQPQRIQPEISTKNAHEGVAPKAAKAKKLSVAPDSEAERLRAFGEAIDEIRERVEAQIGQEDLRYVKKLDRVSRLLEVCGRVLLHVSLDPFTFSAGVVSLWLHKQLQATEIGHTALHGVYDGIEGAGRFESKKFKWDLPIDEEAWRNGHNIRHHQYTNVAGRDPDIHFGHVRLTEHTPWSKRNAHQSALTYFIIFPNFAMFMNGHFTGLIDVYFGNGRKEQFDFIADRSKKSVIEAHKKAFRKYIPYYLKNYVLFPLLAGPGFLKVLLGNWLAETMRDVYSAATIFCGHVGEDTKAYPEGTKAKGRGAWYAMQVEATNNFEVSRPISMLCGGLDRQIEHHLFPKMAPERLRQIAPEVKAVCERFGVQYRTASWGQTLKGAFAHIKKLSQGGGVAGARAVARDMT
ncbi:MAG TPA: acyl-CoA desaturase [Polyangia bacterium]|nr:acyl-CoA desaturase [Polyangia bacterium]